jgi:hypothetical protein
MFGSPGCRDCVLNLLTTARQSVLAMIPLLSLTPLGVTSVAGCKEHMLCQVSTERIMKGHIRYIIMWLKMIKEPTSVQEPEVFRNVCENIVKSR